MRPSGVPAVRAPSGRPARRISMRTAWRLSVLPATTQSARSRPPTTGRGSGIGHGATHDHPNRPPDAVRAAAPGAGPGGRGVGGRCGVVVQGTERVRAPSRIHDRLAPARGRRRSAGRDGSGGVLGGGRWPSGDRRPAGYRACGRRVGGVERVERVEPHRR